MRHVLIALCLLATIVTRSAADDATAVTRSFSIRKWIAIGPLGHPDLEKRPKGRDAGPAAHEFVANLYALTATYPLDKKVDLTAIYRGDETVDCDGNSTVVNWQEVRAKAGNVSWPRSGRLVKGVGLCYFSTWIHATETSTVTLLFSGYGSREEAISPEGASVRCWVNGVRVGEEMVNPEQPLLVHPIEKQKITFRKGWNHIYVKIFSTWSGCHVGLELKGPEAVLWRLTSRAMPPRERGLAFTVDGKRTDGKPDVKVDAVVDQKKPPPPPPEPGEWSAWSSSNSKPEKKGPRTPVRDP